MGGDFVPEDQFLSVSVNFDLQSCPALHFLEQLHQLFRPVHSPSIDTQNNVSHSDPSDGMPLTGKQVYDLKAYELPRSELGTDELEYAVAAVLVLEIVPLRVHAQEYEEVVLPGGRLYGFVLMGSRYGCCCSRCDRLPFRRD